MDFSTPCKIYQLVHVVLYVNNFLSCRLHIFFNRHFFTPRFKENMRLDKFTFATSFILNFPCSSFMEKSTLQSASKILDILQLFRMVWGFISRHTWEHYIVACLTLDIIFPQVMVSSRRIKLRDNPFQKLLLILNFGWSNYSLIQGLYHTCNIRW